MWGHSVEWLQLCTGACTLSCPTLCTAGQFGAKRRPNLGPCSADVHPLPPAHNIWPLICLQVDSGCDKELVFGDPTAPRFVYWENKLRATPSGPDALTFDLLSIWGKIRAGLGAVGLLKGGPMPGAGTCEDGPGVQHCSVRGPAAALHPAVLS
jgi:hypothetical protein